MCRQPGREFDEARVQERASHFQRIGERQPVDERQHLVGKDRAKLPFQHSVQGVAAIKPLEHDAEMRGGTGVVPSNSRAMSG